MVVFYWDLAVEVSRKVYLAITNIIVLITTYIMVIVDEDIFDVGGKTFLNMCVYLF